MHRFFSELQLKMEYKQGSHGIASILTDPRRPCAKSSPDGKCVCNDTSYFPVLSPAPYPCGPPAKNCNVCVTHPKDTFVSVPNMLSGKDRLAAYDGVKCFCNADCPPGYVCDMVNNTCMLPSEASCSKYEVSDDKTFIQRVNDADFSGTKTSTYVSPSTPKFSNSPTIKSTWNIWVPIVIVVVLVSLLMAFITIKSRR